MTDEFESVMLSFRIANISTYILTSKEGVVNIPFRESTKMLSFFSLPRLHISMYIAP